MSPISAETAARADAPTNERIADAHVHQAPGTQPVPPSDRVEPTVVEDAAQQGATQPGSGSTVPTEEASTHKPRFKEQVIGYAKEIRGATMGKPEVKQQGERIVHGQEKFEPKKVGPKA